MTMHDLSGKVAVITGAGRRKGLGEAMARRLAAEGCKVVLSDIGMAKGAHFDAGNIGTSAEMDGIAGDINNSGGAALAIACDVRDEDDMTGLIGETVARFGQIDVMVNNAGVGYLMSPILETDAATWDSVLHVNLRGVFFGIKRAAKQMIFQGGGGRIVNIASQAAKRGFPDLAAYVSSKHALVGLTRTAALEFGGHGITVNSICPNHVTTALGASQNAFRAGKLGLTLDELMAARRGRNPLGREGYTSDIAAMCAFLASPEAQYITGQNLDVSGGEEMH
jgi:meso-butanediol dehydrogenase/(S,S)-butanediol dehydrogenase/diacetyl reductase